MGEECDVEHLLADLRPRLSRALIATYGLERGGEAFAEAMVWAWEHRDELPRCRTHPCEPRRAVPARLLDPQLAVTDDEVVIALAARPLPAGAYHCAGMPPEPVVIELPEPLGNRVVVDAFDLPPRAAVERGGSLSTF